MLSAPCPLTVDACSEQYTFHIQYLEVRLDLLLRHPVAAATSILCTRLHEPHGVGQDLSQDADLGVDV